MLGTGRLVGAQSMRNAPRNARYRCCTLCRSVALSANILSGVRTRCMSGLGHPVDMGWSRD
jgi:hypothetical protein